MKAFDRLVDDAGQAWELIYEEQMLVPVLDALGQPVLEGGRPKKTSRITSVEYRKEGDEGAPWLPLPPWAAPIDEWKITLCWFDEEEDGDLTYWAVGPA